VQGSLNLFLKLDLNRSMDCIALVVFALLRFGQRPAPPPLARMNILLSESRALCRSPFLLTGASPH
jgi:hypothetical protein